MPMPRETLVDKLTRQISARIMNRLFLPGSRLDEKTLAETFHVSRTPVREALGRLSATGLVERRPNRGVVVAQFSADDLRQLVEVLIELEGVCARLAAIRMTNAALAQLATIHDRASQAIDDATLADLNRAFHQLIYQAADNQVLIDQVRKLRIQLSPLRRGPMPLLGGPIPTQAQHALVLAALQARAADQAAQTMRDHIGAVRSLYRVPDVAAPMADGASLDHDHINFVDVPEV